MCTVSDLDRQIAVLRRCELIKESEVKSLCAKAREILVEESNVQRVDAPVTVRSGGGERGERKEREREGKGRREMEWKGVEGRGKGKGKKRREKERREKEKEK
jgi:hypothetical protein